MSMTELDKTLQQIAAKNWEQFVKLVGPDAIIAAKTCILRGQKKTFGEISINLRITERQARYNFQKCTGCDNPDETPSN